MKYRIYRVSGTVEYKDVEAGDMSSAYKHHTDPQQGFTITDSGYILFACCDSDFSKEKNLPELRKENDCHI